jgi:peptide/nickel transport system substrate-binding protein
MSVRWFLSRVLMVRVPTARRRLIVSSVIGFALSVLIASGLAFSDAGAGVRGRDGGVRGGGTLTIGVGSLDYIDPALTLPLGGGTAASLVARGLTEATCALLFRYPVAPPPVVRYDLAPEVATGYPAISSDGRTYTFTIRSGYRFSTGAPVNAASYAAAINRNLNPAMRSPAAQYLEDVVGADAVRQGSAQAASGVKVAGNRLVVRLTRQVPDFPARMTTPNFCPVPAGLPVDPEGVGAPLPGSGPFYVAEFVRGSHVVLERNRFYRGPRAHHLDRIVFRIGDDAVTNSDRVRSGEVDVDLVVPLARLAEIGTRYGVNKSQFFSIPSTAMFYVYMNTESPLFRRNVKLRQAVNLALDRTALLADLGPYFGTTADGYLPTGLPGAIDLHPYPLRRPDLTRARALARGHTRSGKAVYYACNDVNLACLKVAETVQANLRAIGIDVEIKSSFPYSIKATKTATRGEPFDLTDDRYDVPWVDPSRYISVLLDGRKIQATGNTNISYFNSAHYNALIDRAESLSGRARLQAYGKLAFDLATNAAPMAAFISRNLRFFVSSRVGCVRAGAHGLDFAGLCLK